MTAIGHDHAEYLGDTLETIAAEKAGIFKRGCPAVIAPQDYPAADAVLQRAAPKRIGAQPILVGAQDFSVHEERGRLVYQDEDGLLDLPRPRLAGRHQFVNAGTAIAALRAAGFGDLETRRLRAGMARADWPGRLQRLASGRLAERSRRRAASSGSTAATTPTAGGCSRPPWPISRSAAPRPSC